MAKFAYNMSAVMKPMTDLLGADVCWSWDHAQQSSFDETKRLLTTTPTLSAVAAYVVDVEPDDGFVETADITAELGVQPEPVGVALVIMEEGHG